MKIAGSGREPRELERLTIGSFAEMCGVHVETVRFYRRKGLLRAPDRSAGRIRRYGSADVARVRFVKSARNLGFSLGEIRQLLRLDRPRRNEEQRQGARDGRDGGLHQGGGGHDQ